MTNEWFSDVKTSVLIPDTLDTDVWGFHIMDDETIFSISIKAFSNRLECEQEFYNNPTTETMNRLAMKYLNEMIETLKVDGKEYIDKILPLFLEDVIKDE